MMNTKKRWLAALLSVVMVVAMLPSMAFAAAVSVAPQNVKVDVNTGVVTWDSIVNADGTYAKSGEFTLSLEKADKKIVNPVEGDWQPAAGTVSAASDANATDPSKGFKATITIDDALKTLAATNHIRVTVKYNVDTEAVKGDKTSVNLTLPEVDLVKAEAVTRDNVTLELDAETGEGVVKFAAPVANVIPTSYTVFLYKVKERLHANPTVVPSGATLVAKTEVTDLAKLEARFEASKLTWVKDGQNVYFATVVSHRAGYADSAAIFQKANDQVHGESAAYTGLTVTEPKDKADALGADPVLDETTLKATATANTANTTVVLEVRDTATRTLVASVEQFCSKGTETVTLELKDKITKKDYYFATAYVKQVGMKNSDSKSSASKLLSPIVKIDAPKAYIGEDGKIYIEKAKYAPEGCTYKAIVLLNGKKVSGQGVVNNGGNIKNFNNLLYAGVDKIDVDKNSKGYNLKNGYALEIIAEKTNMVSSDPVVASVVGTLAAPKNVVWENVATSVNPIATWSAVDGATSYDVVIKNAANNAVVGKAEDVKATKINAAEYLTAAVAAKAELYFEVTAKADNKISTTVKSLAPNFVVKKAPLGKAMNVKWNGNLATWDKVATATSYTVKKFVNGKQVGPDCTTTTNSYQFKGLAKPGAYEFVVIVNQEKEAGYLSSVPAKSDVKYIAGATVGTPYITKASKTRTTVKLRWTAADDAQLYRIYYKTKGMDSYKMIVKSVRGDATAKTIKGLKKGTRYSFKVKAVNSGAAAYSNVKVVTTTK